MEEQTGQTSTIEELVYQSLGEASMCWSLTPAGVFDSEQAKVIAERLLVAIAADALSAVQQQPTTSQVVKQKRTPGTPFLGRNGG